jgi:hypothetical protein
MCVAHGLAFMQTFNGSMAVLLNAQTEGEQIDHGLDIR